jgi:hypothetical protein
MAMWMVLKLEESINKLPEERQDIIMEILKKRGNK